jgi:hypothetical protein
MGASELELFTDELDQQCVRGHIDLLALAVDLEFDLHAAVLLYCLNDEKNRPLPEGELLHMATDPLFGLPARLVLGETLVSH